MAARKQAKKKNAGQTPVMLQHQAAKRAYPEAVVFFRLGDFYEMFGEDAVLCADALNLTLTSRNKGKPDEIPMAGVPYHAAHGYIGRLLALGHPVAVCEQMADPKTVKGIVPREVVRVLTPGLITHDEHLRSKENNWLAALETSDTQVGVSLLDISTGELRTATFPDLSLVLAELAQSAPREVLVGGAADGAETVDAVKAVLANSSIRSDGPLAESQKDQQLKGLAGDAASLTDGERAASARILRYARACTPQSDLPVRAIGRWDPSATLVIDPNAQRHLELVASNSGEKSATLLAVVDATQTAAGARLLRRRLLAPLTSVEQIRRRLDRVELFLNHVGLRSDLRDTLKGLMDLERLVARVVLGEASPKDLGAIRDSLNACDAAAGLLNALEPLEHESLELSKGLDTVQEVREVLNQALVERPPALAKEGAVFLEAYDQELADLSATRQNGSELVVSLESRLREETGIATLRAKFTRVFGWYLEVSRTYLSKVPKEWRRKQTVANGERYTLEELDELADKIAGAAELHRARELELLKKLNASVRGHAERLRVLAARMAGFDVDSALAQVAHEYDYCRPEVDDGAVLELKDCRHPVVERLAAAGRFVPNDLVLDADGERLSVITGPNMAGKSTFLRQAALAVVLAQMGSYVPAGSALVGICDRVLSRVGASDNLAQGQSTFMVEMRETADILKAATPRSLVILDEIGRGTSTFDGLAIAWAVAEHLDQVCRSRALFATHYHELTELAEQSEHVVNHSVSAKELEGEIVFLHRLVQGAASRSYGVAVAKLAGLPEAVLARSEGLLAALEGEVYEPSKKTPASFSKRRPNVNQLDLFAGNLEGGPKLNSVEAEVLTTLRSVDFQRLSPLDAQQLLRKLQKRL